MRENFLKAIPWHRTPHIPVTHSLFGVGVESGIADMNMFGGGRVCEMDQTRDFDSTNPNILNSFYSCSLPSTQ